jgi:hypothetical protein
MQRFLRTFMAVATFVVVWLVVSPARAWTNSAPVCDPRGATTFAPPPQIQDAEQSLDIPADCGQDDPLETSHVLPGRGPQIDITFSQEPVAAAQAPVHGLVFVERRPAQVADDLERPSGVRSSIERPPRS